MTVVLDSQGLHAWADERTSSPAVILLKETFAQSGGGDVVLPSVVAVEALTGQARDAIVDRQLQQCTVDEALPLPHARQAARIRADAGRGSAVDAVVAASAARLRAHAVVTSDTGDLGSLLAHANCRAEVTVA